MPSRTPPAACLSLNLKPFGRRPNHEARIRPPHQRRRHEPEGAQRFAPRWIGGGARSAHEGRARPAAGGQSAEPPSPRSGGSVTEDEADARETRARLCEQNPIVSGTRRRRRRCQSFPATTPRAARRSAAAAPSAPSTRTWRSASAARSRASPLARRSSSGLRPARDGPTLRLERIWAHRRESGDRSRHRRGCHADIP